MIHTIELNKGNPDVHTVARVMYRNPLTTARVIIENVYYCPPCNKFFGIKLVEVKELVELK